MDRSALALGPFSLACLVLLACCHTESPPRGPEAMCAKACATRASHCSARECSRGCNLILDRLIEREGGHVLACVAKAESSCDDPLWARCAALVGPHADGGPPAPPKTDDIEPEEGD